VSSGREGRGGGGGGGGGASPPHLFSYPSSSLHQGALHCLGVMTLRNHIKVSLQCESKRDAT